MIDDKVQRIINNLHEKIRPIFADLNHLQDPAALNENAETVAQRLDDFSLVTDYLYTLTRFPQIGREEWENRLRGAFARDLIILHFFGLNSRTAYLGELVTQQSQDYARSLWSSPKGTLALTYHGGFRRLLVDFFYETTPDGLIIRAKGGGGEDGINRQSASAATDPRGALFAALRAILDGRQVYVAPDGPHATRTRLINVLGLDVPVAEGAAFLAYESRCSIVWYAFCRSADGFAPVLKTTASRQDGETFEEFQVRFWAFYAAMIEDHLTGDPSDLAIGGRWFTTLGAPLLQKLKAERVRAKAEARAQAKALALAEAEAEARAQAEGQVPTDVQG